MRGQPMVQRMPMRMDAEGRPTSVVTHLIPPDGSPFVSFGSPGVTR